MSKILFSFFLFFIFLIVAIGSIPICISHFFNITKSTGTLSLDSFVFLLTLAVAVLTILVAIIGCFEFSRVNKYTEKVDKFEKDFTKELNNLSEIINQKIINFNDTFDKRIELYKNELNESFSLAIDEQELYLNHSIDYLFQATYFNIN